jgi:hypothetical protein
MKSHSVLDLLPRWSTLTLTSVGTPGLFVFMMPVLF